MSLSADPTTGKKAKDDGDVVLTIGGRKYSGWTEMSISAGIETCPRSADITMTELFPDEAETLIVNPGDACTVSIGADVVVTGYVDRYIPSITAGDHSIRVIVRGKCQDLVDCSAEWPGGQISGATLQGVAQKLAQPYGITVVALNGPGPSIPQFNLSIGETGFEIIERISRYGAMLCYEDENGQLVLAQVGKTKHDSGLTQAENVQTMSVTFAADQRFSEYSCFLQSMDVLTDIGEGGNLRATSNDPNVKRNRKRYIICEAGGGGLELAKPRVLWDAARRAGRAQIVTVRADSWRDSAGKLWTPNQLVPVDLPALHLAVQDLCIGEVTFKRNGTDGTIADLTLMLPSGYLPEPVLLVPVAPDVPVLR